MNIELRDKDSDAPSNFAYYVLSFQPIQPLVKVDVIYRIIVSLCEEKLVERKRGVVGTGVPKIE